MTQASFSPHASARAQLTQAFAAFKALKGQPTPASDTPAYLVHQHALHDAREALGAGMLKFMLLEAKMTVRARVRVDAFLPKRRDPDEFARDAVSSVLANPRVRPTLLVEHMSDAQGELPAYLAHCLLNKVLDYTRQEPLPGLENKGRADFETSDKSATTQARRAAPPPPVAAKGPLSPGQARAGAAATLWTGAEQAQSQPDQPDWPDNTPAHSHVEEEHHPSAEDDYGFQQLQVQIKTLLTPDEYDVFCCDFQDLKDEEALQALTDKHGTHVSSTGKVMGYMSLSTYKVRLKSAKKKLQAGLEDWRPGAG